MLGADAELDQVIFDGASWGTATPAGSDEEADYLGIPGLLDSTQVRDLLRRKQRTDGPPHQGVGRRRSARAGDHARPAARTSSRAQRAGDHRASPDRQSRTAGSITSCGGSAADRWWRRPTPNWPPASRRSGCCRVKPRRENQWAPRLLAASQVVV